MTKREKIIKLYKDNPRFSTRELAREIGCSKRHVRRALHGIRIEKENKFARILVYDLETAPMEAYIWSLWKQVVGPHQIRKDWSILSWSAKWLFDPVMMSASVYPEEAHNRTDASIIKELWNLMEEADIIIAHNGAKFDVPRMNSRFLLNNLGPPSPYRVIDTKKVLSSTFSLSSNSLKDVNSQLNLINKLQNEGFGMWKKAVDGTREESAQALSQMLSYNKVDVLALEDLYLRIRPWIRSHPNINLYQSHEEGEGRCTNCGSSNMEEIGYYYTPAGKYKSFRCINCGAIGRSRYSDLGIEEKQSLYLSTAR